MDGNKPARANDEIIGVVFRRSLMVIAAIAALVVVTLLLSRLSHEQEAVVDSSAIAPVDVPTNQQAPSVTFTDITAESGITFTHNNGAYGDKLLPETMGSGVAFFDYDNDGDQDLLFIDANVWPDQVDSKDASMALYQNDGKGNFTDVTMAAGLAVPVYGMGTAVADYDNDGDIDVFVTAYGKNKMFRNDGGVFSDVSTASGVAGAADAWSTSASFQDIDNDGDLDLFVANYVKWSREADFNVNYQLTGIGRAYGPPNAYPGADSYLYRNEGDGRFTDVSAANGIQVQNPATGEPVGKALAVVPIDVDRDGWMDLMVANDTVQNFLFHNQGNGIFEERGSQFGVAFDRNGKATGAMGLDAAHFRNDQDLGFAIGNFANEMSSLYVTQGAAPPLTDESIVEGIGPASRRALTFGVFFFDYDLDGRLDYLQANGHLESEINKVQSSQHFRQLPQLFWNCGIDCRNSFMVQDVSEHGDLNTPIVGRGASYADIDGDGDLDVVLTQNAGPPLLLRNDQALGHHWLRVKLIGTDTNRDAMGSWVELRAGGVLQRRSVMPSRSYLSQVEPVITFGLGDVDTLDSLDVVWADGSRQTVTDVAVDTYIEVTQTR